MMGCTLFCQLSTRIIGTVAEQHHNTRPLLILHKNFLAAYGRTDEATLTSLI
jgi:hypothetical protein